MDRLKAKRLAIENQGKVYIALPGTLAQIVEKTGMAQSTVWRCLQTLYENKHAHVSGHLERPKALGAAPAIYAAGPGTGKVPRGRPSKQVWPKIVNSLGEFNDKTDLPVVQHHDRSAFGPTYSCPCVSCETRRGAEWSERTDFSGVEAGVDGRASSNGSRSAQENRSSH